MNTPYTPLPATAVQALQAAATLATALEVAILHKLTAGDTRQAHR